MTTDNKCGTCTACCRVYAIPEFEKPAGAWCQHCEIGKSCKIYADRPPRCVDFECLWLQSQRHPGREFVPELRPDKCKVVFSATTNEHVIAAITMTGRPDAWKTERVQALIARLHKAGVSIAVGQPLGLTQLLLRPDGTTKTVAMTPPDKDGMQWTVNEERLT